MNILIAEDDAVSRRLLKSHLEKWGHRVTEAPDGVEAWNQYTRGEQPFVIADWMMPGMDGIELIRRIRARQPARYVYIILLTAKSQKEDIVLGMETGADDFVTKPFDRDELRARVRAGERILELEQSLLDQIRKVEAAQAALVRGEKLSSIGHLAMGVAHEIEDPITVVGGNLYTLRRDVLGAVRVLETYREALPQIRHAAPDLAAEIEQQEKAIELPRVLADLYPVFDAASNSLQRVREVTRNLRDFARMDDFPTRPTSVNDAVADVLTMIKREIESKHAVLDVRPGDVPPIVVNPGKLKKALFNILQNAAEAVRPEGTVSVRTRCDVDNDAVLIEIEDTGGGMPEEIIAQVFEPFFTTKRGNAHAGLGLSVANNIVHEHSGKIEVESISGRGTLFRIRLPMKTPPKRGA
jgi:signal transduction histidine kinase